MGVGSRLEPIRSSFPFCFGCGVEPIRGGIRSPANKGQLFWTGAWSWANWEQLSRGGGVRSPANGRHQVAGGDPVLGQSEGTLEGGDGGGGSGGRKWVQVGLWVTPGRGGIESAANQAVGVLGGGAGCSPISSSSARRGGGVWGRPQSRQQRRWVEAGSGRDPIRSGCGLEGRVQSPPRGGWGGAGRDPGLSQ